MFVKILFFCKLWHNSLEDLYLISQDDTHKHTKNTYLQMTENIKNDNATIQKTMLQEKLFSDEKYV